MEGSVVFLLWSGLRQWAHVHQLLPAPAAIGYFDPRTGTLFPRGWQPTPPVWLVDNNVVTGRTLARAMAALLASGLDRQDLRVAASLRGPYARALVTRELPSADTVEGYLLAFAGPSGVGKSLLARGIALGRGLPLFVVGHYAARLGPGLYGEALARQEARNPFLVAERMLPDMAAVSAPVLIVDGVKRPEQLHFLAHTLRRPPLLFFVQSVRAGERRQRRGDPDDRFHAERTRLFQDGLERLRAEALAVLDLDRPETWQPLARTLERLGFPVVERAWGPDVFGTKRVWLALLRHLAARDLWRGLDLTPFLPHLHRRYGENYGLSGWAATAASLIATGFRFIDDILDEHTVRWGRPSRWTEVGPCQAAGEGALLVAWGRALCAAHGHAEAFQWMFARVLEAVEYELAVEEGRAAFRSRADWFRAARREAAFRAFLAVLAGQPEKARRWYRDGLRAQRTDDLRGAEKGGRENTEDRLRRPLWGRWPQAGTRSVAEEPAPGRSA